MGEPLRFPARRTGTLLRGAFGRILKTNYPEAYSLIFEPVATGPSGIVDAPRPFVLRVSHLEGESFPPESLVEVRLNLFEKNGKWLAVFDDVFRRMAAEGLGPARARAEWRGSVVERRELSLEPPTAPVSRIRVTFRTPTELKVESKNVTRPEFVVVFRRLISRLTTLSTLYGSGKIPVDYRGMIRRAEAIELAWCDIKHSHAERLSRRTGQVHPIGGFAGEVEYSGPLGEFVPYLLVGEHTGIGRQTVWGKGEIGLEILA